MLVLTSWKDNGGTNSVLHTLFLAVTALLGVVAVREGWKSESDEPFDQMCLIRERIDRCLLMQYHQQKWFSLNGEKLGLYGK